MVLEKLKWLDLNDRADSREKSSGGKTGDIVKAADEAWYWRNATSTMYDIKDQVDRLPMNADILPIGNVRVVWQLKISSSNSNKSDKKMPIPVFVKCK